MIDAWLWLRRVEQALDVCEEQGMGKRVTLRISTEVELTVPGMTHNEAIDRAMHHLQGLALVARGTHCVKELDFRNIEVLTVSDRGYPSPAPLPKQRRG